MRPLRAGPPLAALALLLAATAPAGAQQDSVLDEALLRVGSVRGPHFSPDGRRIAFERVIADSAGSAWGSTIWVIGVAGGEPRLLGPGSDPAWAPDGERVGALVHGARTTRIVVHRSDRVSDSLTGVEVDGRVDAFRWAPDGTGIAFVRSVGEPGPWAADPAEAMRETITTGSRLPGAALSSLFIWDVAGGGSIRQLTADRYRVGSPDAGTRRSIPFDWIDQATIVFADSTSRARSALPGIDPVRTRRCERADPTPDDPARPWHSPVVRPTGVDAYTGFAAHPAATAPGGARRTGGGSGNRVLTSGFDRDAFGLHWSDNQTVWFTAEDRGAVKHLQREPRAPAGEAGVDAPSVILGCHNERSSDGVAVRSLADRPDEL